jgi:ribosomal protein S18 acetylase RimI-like enzyme
LKQGVDFITILNLLSKLFQVKNKETKFFLRVYFLMIKTKQAAEKSIQSKTQAVKVLQPKLSRSFTIREMEIGDLAAVYELGEECFKAGKWPMLYRNWDEYEVTTLFNTDGDYCLVAENDDYDEKTHAPDERIVGFVLGSVLNKSGTAWTYGYIIWLCSHENWSREGVASDLVDILVKKMVNEEGVRILMADTDPDNVRAVRFFTKKGFSDQKPHMYLSSNLEQNPLYSQLLAEYRKDNELEKPKKTRKKSSEIKLVKKLKKQLKRKLKKKMKLKE